MTLHEHILINDTLVRKDEAGYNRLFFTQRNPLVIHEEIRCIAANLLFFEEHYLLFINQIKATGTWITEWLQADKLKHNLIRLLTRNRIFNGGILHLQCFISSDGLNTATLVADVEAIENKYPALNEKGLTAILHTQHPLATGPVTPGLLLRINSERLSQGADISLLVNKSGHLTGTPSSPIFIIKEDLCYVTPAYSSGIQHAYREILIQICRMVCKEVFDNHILMPLHLDSADELFVADTIQGLRWIVAFERNRYYCRQIKKIFEQFSRRVRDQLNLNSDSTVNWPKP